MKVAIIPARGGSKRIPLKNVREFCGKPIIGWSIEAAFSANIFDRIIVSTDDAGIAEVARSFGAEVPFVRPPDLADDFATTQAVISHAIKWLIEAGNDPSLVCCLYATAPFSQAKDIASAMGMLEASSHDFVMPVTSFPYPVERALVVNGDSELSMLDPAFVNARSQDLHEAFHDAGQFYCGRKDAWLDARSIFSAKTLALPLPRYRVQDIDTLEDWHRAELLFKVMQKSGSDF